MKGIGAAISLLIGVVLLLMAWQMLFPPESALIREARAAAEALGEPRNLTEHEGLRSTAVCGEVGDQSFVYVHGGLSTASDLSVDQFDALQRAWCD